MIGSSWWRWSGERRRTALHAAALGALLIAAGIVRTSLPLASNVTMSSRGALFGHDVQKHANKNSARVYGILRMLRNR